MATTAIPTQTPGWATQKAKSSIKHDVKPCVRKRVPKLKHETLCVRTQVTPDHVAVYEYSHTDKKTGEVVREWHPVVDLKNGAVDCDCPDFNCRRFPRAREEKIRPDIGTVVYQCKHLQAAVRDCIERNEIILTLKGIDKP